MTTYHADVTRGDNFWWLVTVSETGCTIQAPTLHHLELMARDLVAVTEQVKPRSFDILFKGDMNADYVSDVRLIQCLAPEKMDI